MKVVINTSSMGFNLSRKAIERFAELEGFEISKIDDESFPGYSYYVTYKDGRQRHVNAMVRDNHEYRTNENLIKVVEELGGDASMFCSHLKVVEIPDDVDFRIVKNDNVEEIHEVHRIWR